MNDCGRQRTKTSRRAAADHLVGVRIAPRGRPAADLHECRKRAVIERIYSPALFAALQDSAFEPLVGGHSVVLGEPIKRLGMNPKCDSRTCKRAHSHYRSHPVIS